MATVVIFGSVLMAAIFFMLSIIFNTVGAMIEALEEIIMYILGIIVLVVLLFLALNLIIGIVDNWGNLWHFIGSIALPLVVTIVVIGIIASIGGWLFHIVALALLVVIIWFRDGTEKIAVSCESCFNHFVRVIKNRIDIN